MELTKYHIGFLRESFEKGKKNGNKMRDIFIIYIFVFLLYFVCCIHCHVSDWLRSPALMVHTDLKWLFCHH